MRPSVPDSRHASETPLELLMHVYVQVAPPPPSKKGYVRPWLPYMHTTGTPDA